MIIPIQAATMGYIPGGPFCIATHGLLKCGQRGGRVRAFQIKKDLRLEVESPQPIDVSYLEVLVSALTGDLKTLKGQIIAEADLRRVEEEILLMLEMLSDSL